jgi:hypothetical protein
MICEQDLDALTEEEYVAATAEAMLTLLRASWLTVVVDRERCIRKVVEHNTQWYRDFCKAYERQRRNKRLKDPRTIIKRCHVEATLEKLKNGEPCDSVYVDRLSEVMESFWHKYVGVR